MFVPIIHGEIDINSMQFGFMPGHDTTDEILMLQQPQEKYLSKEKIPILFVDLVKAFDCVPCKVLWCAKRTLGIEEQLLLPFRPFIIHYYLGYSQLFVHGRLLRIRR